MNGGVKSPFFLEYTMSRKLSEKMIQSVMVELTFFRAWEYNGTVAMVG